MMKQEKEAAGFDHPDGVSVAYRRELLDVRSNFVD
jgi:hypothetical protein